MPTTEPEAYGADPQPLGHRRARPAARAAARRAAVAAGHGAGRPRQRRRRLDPHPGVRLRPRRAEADPAADLSEGPLVGDDDVRADRGARASRARCATPPRCSTPSTARRPGDPYVAPPPQRPYIEELGAEPGRLRIGVADRAADRSVEVRAGGRRGGARAPAQLLESLGHAVEDGSVADGLPRARRPDLEDTFLTRWAAGQAATLDQLGHARRPAGRPPTTSSRSPGRWPRWAASATAAGTCAPSALHQLRRPG